MNNDLSPSFGEGANIEGLSFPQLFDALPGLLLILSPKLYILAVTDAYLRETLTLREQVIGRYVFEVFPDNPDMPESPPTQILKASLHQVLTTGKAHKVDMLQYDIPNPEKPGFFLERYRSTTNTPMRNEKGEICCIIHEPVNITEQGKARLLLLESQEREKAALAQAEHQRLRLERLFEQAPAALAILEGPDLVYKVLNDSYQQLFPGRQMLGRPLFEALPELEHQPIAGIIRDVYQTGETFEGKEVLVPVARFQGQEMEDIYWNFIYQALYDAQGQVNGILIFSLDVTEFVSARRQVEKSAEALQTLNYELEERVETRTQEVRIAQAEAERQRQRLEDLFLKAPAAICILGGPDLVFELVNPTHQRMFPERQLLGRPILEALPEIADNPTYQTLRQVYKTGITHEEYELLIPLSRPEDGALEDRYFRYIQQARHDDQGRVDGILVFAFELTGQVNDRKTAEEKARQFNFLANAMPQKVWTALPDGEVNYCNQQWVEYTGLSANELVGWAWKDIIHPEDWKENAKVWQHSLATGERFQLEQRIKSKGGAYRWHLSRALAHYDHQGAISMWVGTNTDIHDQKLTEQALQVLTRELTAANESILTSNEHLAAMNRQLTHINADLDNFIYAASHDLKAPISNIEMLVEELLLELPKESLGREAAHIISLIRGAIDRFKKTIGNMTEISKLQKDNSKEVTLVNLAEIVAEVKLDLEPLIAKSDIRIGTDLNDHPLVSFSEKNMRSIVYNLLSNAIKYRHPEREPGVRISSGEEGDYFVLVVQDNGLGLSLDQQGKLFGMFRRFHDHVEGSGVGLYMVKRIVDNAGGKIKVESRPGEGSTFSVFLKKNAWEAAKPSMPPSGEN